MGKTIVGTFPTRREVELAVEHLVQDYGIDRSDVFIQPHGGDNSAGVAATGADVESGHPGVEKHGDPALAGALEVSVDMNEDETDAVMASFRDAGATDVQTR